MNCNCINEVEEHARQHFEKHNTFSNINSVELGGKFLNLEDKGHLGLSLPVTIEYTKENKKGELKLKNEEYTMAFKYCPFCGKKITPRGGAEHE